MPRGIRHESDIEFALAQHCARIQERNLLFAAEIGVSAHWVTERVSELLSPARERVQHYLPAMREASAGNGRAVEPLALAIDAYSGGPSATVEAQREARQSAAGEVKSKGGPGKFYASLSETAKRELNLRRLSKRKDEMGKRMYKSLLAKINGKTPANHKRPSDLPDKREIYRARHAAKKAGLPAPPLPGEKSTKKAKSAKVVVGRNGHKYPVKTHEEKLARHRIHVARHQAKKMGLPLPPLPSSQSTEVA